MTREIIEELRARSAGLAGAQATTTSCAEIWFELTRQHLEVVANFTTEDRDYLVCRPRSTVNEPGEVRSLEILQRVLGGAGRKSLGFELGVSPSTIAQAMKSALRDMGLACQPARVPPLVVLLAHAAFGEEVRMGVTIAELEHGGVRYRIVSADAEHPCFRALAPAMRDVLRDLLRGSTYADIAARRRTSCRTVANQVATACRQLGVSGRSDLLQLSVSSSKVAD